MRQRVLRSRAAHCCVAIVLAFSTLNCSSTDLDSSESVDSIVEAVVQAPWSSKDIGAVGVPGSAAEAGGQFAVYGSGADIWGNADAFHYVYQQVSGNTEIVAKVTSVLQTDPWAKAGVMIRESLTAGSRHAFVALTPGNGVAFQSRSSTNGSSVNSNVTGLVAPHWVKLVRSGNKFTAFRSSNGTSWTQVGSPRTINMSSSAFIGLAATSHDNTRLGSASFTNVTVGQTSPTHRVDAAILTNITSCAIGDPCVGDTSNCFKLWNEAHTAPMMAFANNQNLRMVRPGDPRIQTAAQSRCLNMTIPPAEVTAVRQELQSFRNNVALWTNNAIRLDLVIHEVNTLVPLEMGTGNLGIFGGPFEVRDAVQPLLSRSTDFVIVTYGHHDAAQGLHTDVDGCGGSYGADNGLAGAPYSAVPQTRRLSQQCALQGVYMHEWLHQTHWAVHTLSPFDDLYDGIYPACGMGNPNTTLWYPDPHECLADPDFPTCGTASCGDHDTINGHILQKHWNPNRVMISNHCKNGIQDFNETGVDVGGSCL